MTTSVYVAAQREREFGQTWRKMDNVGLFGCNGAI